MDEIMGQLKNITSALSDLKINQDKRKEKETVEEVETAPSQSLFAPSKPSTFFKPISDKFNFAEASNPSTSFKIPKTERLDFSSLRETTTLPEKRKSQFAKQRSSTGNTSEYQGIQTSKEGAINLYQLPPSNITQLTQREEKVKKYFPDFFPRSEAENPDSLLREATKRNRVVFSSELKLKCANSQTLEKLYHMQVAMIQSMLPYTAWPVRVASEMDEDFLAARRAINNYSLDWAGAVNCILTVLFKHNVLSAPLANLAMLTVRTGETSLQFARRLRKHVYSLPNDLILSAQQSLPKTWTIIQRDIRDMSNDELSDYVLQVSEGVERWTLEDETYKKQYQQTPIPVQVYDKDDALDQSKSSAPTIAEPGSYGTNAYATNDRVQFPFEDSYPAGGS
ncbi:hypothetical protein OnM2_001001 [Erysiphe neolycopersici]|uniref:Uncharacterized protein n=1 Tax=Erysiphe neolycopersici TaxID=212602 RepID=A0A420I845_9PEZI|nr:hypothetical protein OnM2_001001 [Erysiphe neolycopersici]